jgi:hypothetical protein
MVSEVPPFRESLRQSQAHSLPFGCPHACVCARWEPALELEPWPGGGCSYLTCVPGDKDVEIVATDSKSYTIMDVFLQMAGTVHRVMKLYSKPRPG